MTKIILICLLLAASVAVGQDDFTGGRKTCPPTGDAKDDKSRNLNVLKNRWTPPGSYVPIPFSKFIHAKEGDFSVLNGASITAYVFDVKLSGVESCECHDKTEAARDFHITLTADAKHTLGKDRAIVELTSRVRAKHPEWVLWKLKGAILHKMVTFNGWLFRDDEHKPQSFVDNPKNKHDWRGSRWELHPIFEIIP